MPSYIHRLAHANCLDAEDLRIYLAEDGRKHAGIALDRLAVLSGQPVLRLRRALYGLLPPPGDATELCTPGRSSLERIGCTLCMARRGIRGAVIVRLHRDQVVCRRHLRWLGDSGRSCEDEQLSLARQPEILAANRVHWRVVRRHGRSAVAAALSDAEEICGYWRRRFVHDESFQRLMCRFYPGHWQAPETDPTVEAASYPQTIALTRLLVSPVWREMPFDHTHLEAFVTEVRRTVAPTFWWNMSCSYGRYDRLVELYLRENRARRQGDPPCTPIFATPQRPMSPWRAEPDWHPIPPV